MTANDIDPVVADAIARVPVPERGESFWDDVRNELDAPAAKPRERQWRVLLSAAAALIVVVAVVAALNARSPEERTLTNPTATQPQRSGQPGAEATLLAFLDALGTGELETAAAKVGPTSEAYMNATSGSVRDFLVVAEEGFGAWAQSDDRSTTLVELEPGQVVVVVSGTLNVEGNTERRDDAFPMRYAESAGAWFVERWAWPAGTDPRIEVVRSSTREITAQFASGDGTAWLSVNGERPNKVVAVGNDAPGEWTFGVPLDTGDLVTIAFENDSVFTAVALRV